MGVAVGVGVTEGWAVVVPVAFMLALDGAFEVGVDVFSNPSPRTAAITITITIISAIMAATQLRTSISLPVGTIFYVVAKRVTTTNALSANSF